MKYSALAILLITVNFVFGQKETLLFKISKPKSEVTIHTSDTIFYEGVKNYFSLEVTGKDKISHVSVAKSKAIFVQNGMYYANFEEGGNTILKVFLKGVDGKVRLGLLQEMYVKPLPTPVIELCGVAADSAISAKQLVREFELRALMGEDRYIAPIVNYKIVLGTDTVKVYGNKIPLTIKPRLNQFYPGDILEILDVNVKISNDSKIPYKIVSNFTVFIIEDNRYSVGYRNR